MQKVLTHIYIYPIKGLGAIELNQVRVEPRGLEFDRRMMLVDSDGLFISQRENPELALFKLVQTENGFEISEPQNKSSLLVPFKIEGEQKLVKIWNDDCLAIVFDKFTNEWFSDILQKKCSLVYMPETSKRLVDSAYSAKNNIVSFADGFPILIIGEASLTDLNMRLANKITMDRFRPNLVFSGGTAFEEDTFGEFYIGNQLFYAAKPCARCNVITINQQTGIKTPEPLSTLSSFRSKNNKVYFGENVLPLQEFGFINTGDFITINSTKTAIIP